MFAYRIGAPLWKVAARAGCRLVFHVNVHLDKDTGSYWAESSDLDGLVVAAPTLDELRSEMRSAAESLLEFALNTQPKRVVPEMRFADTALCAA
jgi:predicted RNase H-like HicB family nuclease